MSSGEDRRPLLLGAADVATVFDLDTGLASQREAFSRLGRGIPLAGADKRTFNLVERAALSVGIAVACVLIRVTEGGREPYDEW